MTGQESTFRWVWREVVRPLGPYLIAAIIVIAAYKMGKSELVERVFNGVVDKLFPASP